MSKTTLTDRCDKAGKTLHEADLPEAVRLQRLDHLAALRRHAAYLDRQRADEGEPLTEEGP